MEVGRSEGVKVVTSSRRVQKRWHGVDLDSHLRLAATCLLHLTQTSRHRKEL